MFVIILRRDHLFDEERLWNDVRVYAPARSFFTLEPLRFPQKALPALDLDLTLRVM